MMELENSGSLALAVVPQKTQAVAATKQPSRIREMVSWGIFWAGMALIALAAIPTGVLCAVIYGLVLGVNFLMDKVSGRERAPKNETDR